MTINELTNMYQVGNRTIQSNIKKLGYEWYLKQSTYHYTGDGPEPTNLRKF